MSVVYAAFVLTKLPKGPFLIWAILAIALNDHGRGT
jgi:hypothetical protein